MPNIVTDCANAIHAASGGRISKAVATAAVKRLHAEAKAREKLNKSTLTAELNDIAGEIKSRTANRKALERRNALLELKRRNNMFELLKASDSVVTTVLGMTDGVSSTGRATKLSVDALKQAVSGHWIMTAYKKIEEAGALKDLQSGKIDGLIRREAEAISNGIPKGQTTGNMKAAHIAEALMEAQERASFMQNMEGAAIEKLRGYVVAQVHNQHAMLRGGAEGKVNLSEAEAINIWKDFVRPLIDLEHYAAKGIDSEKFLEGFAKSIYTNVLGTSKHDANMADALGPAQMGPISKAASEHRLLVFKDASAEDAYAQKYAGVTLEQGFTQQMNMRAQAYASVKLFGDDPQNLLRQTLRAYEEFLRGQVKNPERTISEEKVRKHLKEIEVNQAKLSKALDQATGVAGIVADPSWQRAEEITAGVARMAMLGKAIFAQFSDVMSTVMEAKWQGASTVEALMGTIEGMLSAIKDRKARIAAATDTAVALDIMGAHAMSRFDQEAGMFVNGLRKWERRFSIATLVSMWTDVLRTTNGSMNSWYLAKVSSKSFSQLGERTRNMLNIYGINAHEWDYIRTSPKGQISGHEGIFSGNLRDPTDADLEAAGLANSYPNRKRYKLDVEDKLRTMLSDRVSHAVVTPGTAERRMLTFNTQPGTKSHFTMRILTLFKGFPLAFMRKRLGAEIQGRGFREGHRVDWLMNSGGPMALLQTVIGMTMIGYVADSLRAYASGKERRKWLDKDGNVNMKTALQSMARGGGLAIVGDMLFREYDKSARNSFSNFAAGPVFGQLDSVFTLYGEAQRGDLDGRDVGKAALGLARRNIPFMNHFLVSGVLDHMLWNQMAESLTPGTIRRLEREAEKAGQPYLFPLPDDPWIFDND